MHRSIKLALSALLPVVMLAGCSDWLTGNKITQNPNAPTVAGKDPLLVAIQVGQTDFQTGDLARLMSVWMQQMGGSDRQYISFAQYQFDEDAFSGDWSLVYTGGGLIDERALEKQALASGDSTYAGIAKVWEALTIGTAADLWGAIPYSQAVDTIAKPDTDSQEMVYTEVQASLDSAIDWLKCDQTAVTSCAGPFTGADLFYNNNTAAWLELAHTLKARFYLHVAPQMGDAAYTAALAQADSGISTPNNDFKSYQSTNPNEWNLWYQFMVNNRSGYISAGSYLVNLLKSTNDPRLAAYYSRNSSGQFAGAPAGGGSGDYSSLSDARLDPGFRQPIVTYAENQLIKSEAAFRLGQAGVALTAFNAERMSQGVPPKGSVTLNDILTEKYIADFQEIEAWNDYKRTCLPAVPLSPGGVIPGRLLYPLSTERNANPNIPAPSAQPQFNWDQTTFPCPGPG